MNKHQAYPSIDMCIRELLLINNNNYDIFMRYITRYRYPDNTWIYLNHHELRFIHNIFLTINQTIKLSFVRDNNYNYKFTGGRNIYHVICSYEYIKDPDDFRKFISIINKYFDEDINRVDVYNLTPIDHILLDSKNKDYIKIMYEHGAIISNKIIEKTSYDKDLHDFLFDLTCPDVKYPGYD